MRLWTFSAQIRAAARPHAADPCRHRPGHRGRGGHAPDHSLRPRCLRGPVRDHRAVQLEVSALGGGGFDEALADTCSSVPGVGAVVPRVVGVVALLGPKGRMPVLIQGKSVEGTAAGDTWICCQGHWPSGGGEALLDSGMADRLGLHPGNRVLLWAPSGAAELSLVGLLRPARPRAMGGNLIVTFETARNLLGLGANQQP